jgi:glucokinase
MSTRVIGIDIGGTKIAGGIVGPDGQVAHPQTIPTPATERAPGILRAIVGLVHDLLDAARREGVTVSAVGIGTAGQVDHARGIIIFAGENLPGWTGMPLADELGAALGLPVSVENDVNALALGEGRFGAGKDFASALYVAVGTGVGGAVVIDGKLWRGATWTAGEICHLLVDIEGKRRCTCGQYGHLEAYAAGPAMAARYGELAGVVGPPCDLRAVAEKACTGDPLAVEAIAEGARILGLAVGGLLNVIDTEAVIIGGGVPDLGTLWWEPFEAALRNNANPGPAKVALRRAELGGQAVLVGAALLALEEVRGGVLS